MPDDARAAVPSDGHDYEHGFDGEHDLGGEHGPDEGRSSGGEDGPDEERSSDEACDEKHDAHRHPDSGRARERFEPLAGADYDRVNEFLKARVAFTAREWVVARLCADFRTGTGVEMTRIGEQLPALVPFMDEPYSKQAVCSARRSFREKVQEAAATFLYGAYADFLTAEEIDEVVYEATEVAKFLIEVEGGTLPVDDELSTEDRVRAAMEAVHEASLALRYDRCPHCGEELDEDAAVTEPA